MKPARRKPWERPVLWGVVCLIPLAAALSIPSFTMTTGGGNETAAIASLRILHTAQLEFQSKVRVDGDLDGRGEFGCFSELSGATWLRGGTEAVDPPLISGAYRNADETGRVSRSGYWFRVYLPGPGGAAVSERGAPASVSIKTDCGDSTGFT